MEVLTGRTQLRGWVRLIVLLSLFAGSVAAFEAAAIGQQNPIQAENARPGTTGWQLQNPAGDNEGSQIEGYASATSVNRGANISFFVRTTGTSYTIAIYRLGWYGGLGGRLEVAPKSFPAISQPLPTPDPTFGMTECNWTSQYTLTTSNPSDPTDWVSGIYVAKLTSSTGFDRYILFVVRDDSRSSSLVYQQSVNTSQAYDNWGGKSLYGFNSTSSTPAVKVSFNRPDVDGWGTGTFLSYEQDMVGFLESEGYDVSYTTDVDTHERGSLLTNHSGFLSVGHNEYWSLQMRQNVTAARDAGVGLAFFSANSIYWQIRYEPSPITGVADRTIVAYKEIANTADPDAANPATYPLITTRFRDPHGNLPGQPEDSLMGIMYNGEEPASGDIVVKNTGTWVFQGTGLSDGDHLPGILGYEVDGLSNDSTTPSNVIQIAHSPYSLGGQTFAGDSSVYQASSGAWVFAAGSIEWSWGLNNISNWANQGDVDAGTQQITRNVLDQFINNGTITTPTPVPTTTPVPTATPTPGPGGTIALRSVATGSTSAASSLVTIPVPAGVVANDVMIAQVTVRGGAATTLTAPAGWSLVRRDNDTGGQIADGIYLHIVTAASEPASYTWNFSAGNDAAGGIAAYSGVNTAAPIDVSAGQANASSTSMTAPSIIIPSGHNADRLLAVFATANSAAITLPGAVSGRWNFRAIGFGISAAMGDASVPSGATGNFVALQGSSAVNIGVQVALQPAPGSATPTPVPTGSPTPIPTASPTPLPTASPTPLPTASPTPTGTPTSTGTPTPVPTPTPTPGPGGTIALRSVATGSTSAASSLVTIPVPAGVVANDVMIAQVTVRGGAATTLTAPAGWSLVRRDNDTGGQIADGIYLHIVTAASEPASYTWNFSAGNDAAGGIAAYSGVNTAAPIDVSGGQANASSTSMTAPSITIPSGHNTDRLLAAFATANSAAITLPGAVSRRWNFRAIGFGISAAMGDASVPSGATGNFVALQGSSTVNIGIQVALQPAPGSATPTPVPTASPTPLPTASPTPLPTASPTPLPTDSPTPLPTDSPTPMPTASPTSVPTASPTPVPTDSPTPMPTDSPTPLPTASPTPVPTASPTPTPTGTPTPLPTTTPVPTATPTPGGTIALRSVATGSTSAAGSLVTIPVPAGVVANDVMIAQVTVRGGAATTLTAPAGWSLVRRDNDTGGQIADGIYLHIVTAASEPASYTWNFSAGNDAAGGIAAYSGVNTAAPIDVSGGQANASSTSMTAPSITIPSGHNTDRLLAVFATANSAAITLPGAVSGRWNFRAIGFGISAAMGDASVPSGATGNFVALQGSGKVNIGALVALVPAN